MLDQTTLAEPISDDSERILKYLVSAYEFGSLTQDEVEKYLGHRNPDVRCAAAKCCSRFTKEFAALAGRALLGESEPVLRMCAAELLGEYGVSETDTLRLIFALQDQSWIVRSSAALALGCIGGQDAFQQLANRLEQDPNEAVRRDIAHAIAEFGAAAIVPIESALRNEKSRIARCGLLNGYYNLTGEGLMHLLALLTDTDVVVRSNAINCWVWDEIKPEHTQKVVAALTMLVGTDENAANVEDAKSRLNEYGSKQKLPITQSTESVPEIEFVPEKDQAA